MRPQLLLDLDNTLLCALTPEEADEFVGRKKKGAKHLGRFEMLDMGDFQVYLRPGVHEFLDYAFANFRVSVFTAASFPYGAYIVDNLLLPKGKRVRRVRNFGFFFAQPHSDASQEKYGNPKDLRLLSEEYGLSDFSKKNTLFLDDLPEVGRGHNSGNVVRAKYFDVTKKSALSDSFLEGPAIEALEALLATL